MKETEEVWIKADGKRMPPIDEEVVALVETESQHHCKVVFAHRVDPNGDAVGYGLCGWNIPRVKYWLDAELPNMDEEDADDQRKRKWFYEIRNGNGEVVRSRAFDTYEDAERDLARFDGLRNGFHRFTYEIIE